MHRLRVSVCGHENDERPSFPRGASLFLFHVPASWGPKLLCDLCLSDGVMCDLCVFERHTARVCVSSVSDNDLPWDAPTLRGKWRAVSHRDRQM